jgi:hypothetical protein
MRNERGHRRLIWLVAVGAMVTAVAVVPILSSPTAAADPHVLRVGTWNGIAGQYATIADAVSAAQPGDWVLVGPGDYHEQMDHQPNATKAGAAVLITTAGLHLRGMDRNQVVIDGTKPGAPQCSSAPGDQDLGPLDGSSQPLGRNGLVVSKVDGTTVDNLTACNFLNGNGGGGNEIWWNGGDGSGLQGMNSYSGSYLSTTTTYYETGHPRGEYGIFVSNAKGPGSLVHTYGNDMADAAYYIGACPDCNAVLDDAHGQGSALGYSGTNSGGRLIIQNSEFDHNKTGFSTNSQNNDDAPSPQTGICPTGLVGPLGNNSCWVFRNNFVHDNNNADVPSAGSADLGPPGTGVVISGGSHDTVVDNRFEGNGSWAVLIVPFIDSGPPPPVANCAGGLKDLPLFGIGSCFFISSTNEITGNTFTDNGGFGNVTNGDLGDLGSGNPGNCWHGNTDTAGSITSAPIDLQTTNAVCGQKGNTAALIGSDLTRQVQCATEIFGPCLPGVGTYPRGGDVHLLPLPAQATMPDPCAGVPTNPWCPATPVTTVTSTSTTSTSTPGGTEAPVAEPAKASPQLTG